MEQDQKQNHKNGVKDHDHHGFGHPHGHPEKKADESAQVNAPEAAAAAAQMSAEQKPKQEEKPKTEHEKDLEKIDELQSQVGAVNDKYLRLMAEFDNYKRRTLKENQQIVEQANEKLIKDIIDVRENFERAFKAHKEGADAKPFIDGMKMVFTKLDNVLHRHGLEVYTEAGQEFDPQLHDAMMKTPHETIPEHHIAEVCEKGYRLKGKVIKHSKVIVSSGKPAPAQEKKEKASCAPAENEAVFEVESEPNDKEKKEGTEGA
ncbi:MAG TPA: nucleotide exchange factor GrpE [Chitinivibrionales bacterium]|nr:nucleotide exchange factor GrpE [Chitinivibrionales bacterium]